MKLTLFKLAAAVPIMLLACLLTFTGCENMPAYFGGGDEQAQAAALQDAQERLETYERQIVSAKQVKQQYEDQLALLEESLANATTGSEAEELHGKISDHAEFIRTVGEPITALEQQIRALQEQIVSGDIETAFSGDTGAVAATAQSAGAIIPQPWGAVVAGTGTLIGLLGSAYGAARRRDYAKAIAEGAKAAESLRNVVDSVDAARGRGGISEEGIKELARVQTPETKAAVRKAQAEAHL